MARGWPLRPLRRDPWLAGLAALAALQYSLLAPRLLYPDLGLDYPFHGGDSLDWLLNALALAGEDVRNSVRPPVLPLALALLRRLGLLSWFPLLNLALHHAAAVGSHLVLRRRFGRAAAFTCGLLVLTGASVLPLALQVMADLPAAILLGASGAAFLAAGSRPGLYLAAGVLGGLSAVTQQAALLLPLPAGVTVLAARRPDLRRWQLWAGAAAFAAFPAAWFGAKRILAGTFLDAGTLQWGLLGFHPENLPHYLVAALSFWGWPALLLVTAGAIDAARAATGPGAGGDDRAWALFPLLTTLSLLAFFALGYDFLAKRFLLYALFPSLPLLARALARLRGTRALVPAAALTVAVAAWPLPNPDLADQATLWPLPTVYSVVPTGEALGDPLPRLGDARLAVVPPSVAVGHGAWSRVWQESRGQREGPPARAALGSRLGDVERAFYLAGPGGEESTSYDTRTRLGYLLGRRVAHVPEALYPDDWWGWQGLEPVGVVDRYRLFRLRLPPVTDGAIVAVSSRNPRGPAVGGQGRRGERFAPPPAPSRLERDLARARGVAAHHARDGASAGPLLVLPEARGDWEHLLPFFLDGVLERPEGAEAARVAALAERGARHTDRVGGLLVIRATWQGRPFTVVRGEPRPAG